MTHHPPRTAPHRRLVGAALAVIVVAAGGCASPEDEPDAIDLRQQPPSEDPAAVQAWLDERFYEAWDKEPIAHPSLGPHFGLVRTYVNRRAYQGIMEDMEELPRGAVAVKVLFGADPSEVRGHALSYKVAAQSSLGDGWYWYERFDGNERMSSRGADTFCAECHIEPPRVDLIKSTMLE